MLSVKSIQNKKHLLFLAFGVFLTMCANAQENSPFSRYGIGDIFPNQSVQYKALGGMTAAQGNPMIIGQPNLGTAALNPDNPASYGFMKTRIGGLGGAVNYDLGVIADLRTLQRATPSASYNSANFMPSYFTVGFPVHKSGVGMAFGIKPVTRISYNTTARSGFSVNPLTNKLDSAISNNTGEGGLNQVFLGIGKSFKNFRVGINAGYNFGSTNYKTLTSVLNDTFAYETSLKNNFTRYRGFTWDAGLQQTIKLRETNDPVSKIRSTYNLDLGVSGAMSQKLKATQEQGYYTVTYDDYDVDRIDPKPRDTISYVAGQKSTITLPMQLKGGFMFNKYLNYVSKYGLGAEYNMANWADFRGVNDRPDTALSNSWMIRAGGYFVPDPLRGTNIFATARYSIGGYYGKDYINVGNTGGEGHNVMAITFGVGLLLRNQAYGYQMPSSIINTSFEIGKRGNSSNNISENFYKLSVGFSLRDIWLVKRRYD